MRFIWTVGAKRPWESLRREPTPRRQVCLELSAAAAEAQRRSREEAARAAALDERLTALEAVGP